MDFGCLCTLLTHSRLGALDHLVVAQQVSHAARALLGHTGVVVGDVTGEAEVLGVVDLARGLIHVAHDVAHQRAIHELHGLLVQLGVLLEVQHPAVLDVVDRRAALEALAGQDAVGVITDDAGDDVVGEVLCVHCVRGDGLR